MKNLTYLLFIFLSSTLVGQNVGINASGTAPNASAGLDVDFTNKGVLVPRVALTGTTDATTVPSPATSLLVYNLGTGGLATSGYYYNAGTPASPTWVSFTSGQNSTTYFTTGAITINNSAGYYNCTGFPVTINVPAGCKTVVSVDIGLQLGANSVAADVFLIVDGAFTNNGAYYRAGGSNLYGNNDAWEKISFTQALNLTPGNHTLSISGYRASGGTTSFIIGGDGTSVLQGEMTVTFIKN